MNAGAVPVGVLHAWGCWAEIEFPGSAIRYVFGGGAAISVVIGGRERTTVPARCVETLADVVRLAVDDWRTWGGKVSRLPRSAPRVRLYLVWPTADAVEVETVAA